MNAAAALRPSPFPLVLAGPSGSGKTTIGREIVERRSDVWFSISATTRERRVGEVDGRDYQFCSREEFRRMMEDDRLLEYARVHGELYGTPRANLEGARAAGAHLLLDIDVQGARSVRAAEPAAVTVFLLPPDGTRIVERLRRRGREGERELQSRLRAARQELAAIDEFDYVIVNDDLEEAVRALDCVVGTETRNLRRLGRLAADRASALADEIERELA